MAKSNEIPESKIRQAIWMLKAKKTKKAICEHLDISYNVKKLDSIIQDFLDKEEREKALKASARKKTFSKKEKEQIAKDYLAGEAQSSIAKRYYISPQRVKSFLIEMNVPIRARSKKQEAKTDHIVQDLETKFNKKDKVFFKKHNCFAEVVEVYDEDYLDFLSEGKIRYIETRKTDSPYEEPKEGVHYELYWQLEKEEYPNWKLHALQEFRKRINKVIEETGRESYKVWKLDDYGGYYYVNRDDLYPIQAQ